MWNKAMADFVGSEQDHSANCEAVFRWENGSECIDCYSDFNQVGLKRKR